MKLSTLENRYTKYPAAILGGGATMPAELASITPYPNTQNWGRVGVGLIKIAVNYHAHEIGLTPDFMVYLDDPRTRPQMLAVLTKPYTVKVSPEYGSDVEMDCTYWRGNNSATTAAWLGLFMGCNPVYLCGMDLYTNDVKYCHANFTPDQVPTMSTDDLMRPWIEECRASVPHPERLVAVSGPLQSLFPISHLAPDAVLGGG